MEFSFSPDGKYLLVTSVIMPPNPNEEKMSFRATIWDVAERKVLHRINFEETLERQSLSFGGVSGAIRFWKNEHLLVRLWEKNKPEGTSEDGEMRFRYAITDFDGNLKSLSPVFSHPIRLVSVTNEGGTLLAIILQGKEPDYNSIRVLKVPEWETVTTLSTDSDIIAPAFTPDSKYLVTTGPSGTTAWELSTSKKVYENKDLTVRTIIPMSRMPRVFIIPNYQQCIYFESEPDEKTPSAGDPAIPAAHP